MESSVLRQILPLTLLTFSRFRVQPGRLLTAERLLSFDHDYEEGSGQYAVAASRLGTNQAVYGEGEFTERNFLNSWRRPNQIS